ncbi:hypothetical protein [Microbacterium binotii]|uniref:Uncharacterized protein n=1 Tax=Microbacterium binotii TaxID=462710 RepID=A0ABN3PBC7_9MICO
MVRGQDRGHLHRPLQHLPGGTGGIDQLRELIDELDAHGALRADLAEFYHLNIDDVWDGHLDPAHVIVLTAQLQLNPRSRVFAIRGGAPEMQGWDAATVIAARTHNLILSLIGGLSKGQDIKPHLIEYPGRNVAEEEAVPKTLAEFISTHIDTGRFDAFMGGKE